MSQEVQSNFDIIIIVYIIFTVVVDGLVHISLQLIATKGPLISYISTTKRTLTKTPETPQRTPSSRTRTSHTTNDHHTVQIPQNTSQHTAVPPYLTIYRYLFHSKYPLIALTPDLQEPLFNETIPHNDYYIDTTPMRLFATCTCYKYLKFSLQLWAFCCGFLALYLSLVFWMNLFAEFCLAAIGRSEQDPGSIFGLVALYFLVEIIFWCLKRQIDSIILLTHNIGDKFDNKIILIWRIYDVVFIIICAGCSRINSSVWFFQTLMLLMITRGFIWQLWHSLLVFFATVAVSVYKFSNALDGIQDGRTRWLNWKEFVFAISYRPEPLDECNGYKYIYCGLIWLLVIVFLAMIPVYKELFVFCAVIMIIYYLIIVFDAGKYHLWYALWSGKYHAQYYGYNVHGEESKEKELVLMTPRSTSNKYDKLSTNEAEYEQKEEKDVSDDEEDTAMRTGEKLIDPYAQEYDMVLMEFWDKVRTAHNPYMCSCCWCLYCDADHCPISKDDCGKACRLLCRDLAKWICIAILILIACLTVSAWLQPQPSAMHPPTLTTPDVAAYEVCHSAWAAAYLTIVDLVYLVKASSFIDWEGTVENEQILNQFDIWFGNETQSGWNYSTLFIHPSPGFFYIKHEDHNIHLLINRPTATDMDLIQDIRLYGESCLFKVFSFAIPLSSLLPTSFIRNFVYFASIPEYLLSPDLRGEYSDRVYDYMTQQIVPKTNDSSRSYIVQGGHSLGAGLTDVVGARMFHDGFVNNNNPNNISMINFALGSPGTVWSSKKFGYNVEDIDKSTSIHLVARRDLVSTLIDIQGGNQQTVRCIQPDPLSCHFSTNYFCELYRSCGNLINTNTNQNMFRNRTFTKCVCEEGFDFKYCW
eukprot:30923_1